MSAQRIGSYEIIRMLARGGMAVVYLVRQPALDREVVLKRLDLESDDPTMAQRFVGEARLAATLDHPNVVTLFDFFEHDGVPYIAMEYVAGGSLRSLAGTLELPQIFAAAGGHARRPRARGAPRHRPPRPQAERTSSSWGGRPEAVKLLDFGIARITTTVDTQTGTVLGTPAYMAPEQVLPETVGLDHGRLRARGRPLRVLAGRSPFVGDTPVGVLYCHVHKPPPPLAELAPATPPAVRDWVHWLLAKAPRERPRSAAAGVGRARGDRGRRARAVLAPRRGDHRARPGTRGAGRATTPS